VQLHPGGQDRLVGVGDGGVVPLEHHPLGGLGPAEGVDVAQATPAVLEVRLEEERDLPRAEVTILDRPAQLAQPALRPLPPQRQGPGRQILAEAAVTGDHPGREQGGGRVEVVARQAERLLGGAHGVAELQALVPDRVPQPLRHRADVPPTGVDQHHVDVALR
jgi:hypothetical protein